jgi:hypothetical protein
MVRAARNIHRLIATWSEGAALMPATRPGLALAVADHIVSDSISTMRRAARAERFAKQGEVGAAEHAVVEDRAGRGEKDGGGHAEQEPGKAVGGKRSRLRRRWWLEHHREQDQHCTGSHKA